MWFFKLHVTHHYFYEILKLQLKDFMINFRVKHLDELLIELRSSEVEVDENIETYDYGKFGWIYDPEGNRIELWEPF